jgi:hypothetical protein
VTTAHTTAWRVMVPMLIVAMAGLAACGDDGDDEGGGGGQPKAEYANYCAAALSTEQYPEPQVNFEALTPPQQAEVWKAYASGVAPLAETQRSTAPEKIRKDVNLLVDKVNEVRTTGNVAVLEEENTVEAAARVHEFELDNCGWAGDRVDADEYVFRDVATSVNAGVRSFELTNKGKEPHELQLVRINDGVNESLRQLLDLPREQFIARVRPMGSTFAEPGKKNWVVADLAPGRYAMICFIPVGGAGEGPPHYTRGMLNEFQVT